MCLSSVLLMRIRVTQLLVRFRTAILLLPFPVRVSHASYVISDWHPPTAITMLISLPNPGFRATFIFSFSFFFFCSIQIFEATLFSQASCSAVVFFPLPSPLVFLS